jgi:hypothetical protein
VFLVKTFDQCDIASLPKEAIRYNGLILTGVAATLPVLLLQLMLNFPSVNFY